MPGRHQTPIRTRPAAGIFAAVCLLATIAMADRAVAAYPERAVTMVVPFAAGGAIDIVARVLGEPLSRALGQPVVIDNRAGGGGNIGVVAAARARPDGYTILMGSSSFAINPSLYKRITYDPFKDFVPVADVGFYPCVIATRTSAGINTLRDLIALARAEPGKLNFATPGNGTVPHLAVELLKLRAGIRMVHIPYRGGGQAAQSLIAGTVEIASLAEPQALQHLRAGRIKALGLTGRARSPDLPDVPTLVEAGYADAVAETWQGLFAPAGTSRPIVDRVARATIAILRRPDVIDKFRKLGLVITGKGPEALGARIADEVPRWREVIEKGGLRIQ